MHLEDMDFSVENDFQERLLKKIRNEYFVELSDDDLEFVNAASGVQNDDSYLKPITLDGVRRK